MNRRRGLGSGLGALLQSGAGNEIAVRMVNIEAIHPNRSQPRTHFNEQALDELAASIREHGVLQPLVVISDPEGGYELIAGERRWRASQRAGLSHVPVIVKEDTTPQQLLELALVENVQRADLNPLEEGVAYQALRDEFGLSDEEIAKRVGKSRVAIVNARRLIKLQHEARQALLDGRISGGHGRALLRFADAERQLAVLRLIHEREISVREVERIGEAVYHPAATIPLQEQTIAGRLSVAQAQALLHINDPDSQIQAIEAVLQHQLSGRETDQFAHAIAEGTPIAAALAHLSSGAAPAVPARPAAPSAPTPPSAATPAAAERNPADAEVIRALEAALGTPVQIQRSGKTIRVAITLYDDEQLQGLYDVIVGGSNAA